MELLNDVASCSDKITVQVADGTLSALVTERNEESGWQNWIKTEQT